jgi:hypothetical protein
VQHRHPPQAPWLMAASVDNPVYEYSITMNTSIEFRGSQNSVLEFISIPVQSPLSQADLFNIVLTLTVG